MGLYSHSVQNEFLLQIMCIFIIQKPLEFLFKLQSQNTVVNFNDTLDLHACDAIRSEVPGTET